MNSVVYPPVSGLYSNPAFSPVAVVPSGGVQVWVGGQNAVASDGQIVGKNDVTAQVHQVRVNLEAALTAAGCGWADVVRIQVLLRADQDLRAAYAAFGPALAGRDRAPLVGVALVAGLAHPDFLVEVGLEAVRP